MAFRPHVMVTATAPQQHLDDRPSLWTPLQSLPLELLRLASSENQLVTPRTRANDLVVESARGHRRVVVLNESEGGAFRHFCVEYIAFMRQLHARTVQEVLSQS
jgi:hypothetical protein